MKGLISDHLSGIRYMPVPIGELAYRRLNTLMASGIQYKNQFPIVQVQPVTISHRLLADLSLGKAMLLDLLAKIN